MCGKERRSATQLYIFPPAYSRDICREDMELNTKQHNVRCCLHGMIGMVCIDRSLKIKSGMALDICNTAFISQRFLQRYGMATHLMFTFFKRHTEQV